MEADELGERLRAHADGLTEYPTQVTLAEPEVDGDGGDAGARQPRGCLERNPRVGATRTHIGDAFGDRALDDRSRVAALPHRSSSSTTRSAIAEAGTPSTASAASS